MSADNSTTPTTESDFPDPTRLHIDAYVYMGGAVVFAVILTTLFVLNYMWCECLCANTRASRAKCKAYDAQEHNSLALMDSSLKESLKEKM
ncbi:unnamed protein product [Bursaphelenchus okinawaensis]|uniref:Uncharacterized protein n=1 Tax=Bursaphelenchus okinawaensis TaxID=465554 RepID=A0A811KA47_9BILA|nr:unnamed protein product [Bursaphelenchus okinawaensis]CAG9095671.1 unnamed protein product [Bursaphelenchus okinawaensis]